MFSLADIYHPITAAPFRNNPYYREIPPCEILKPYIRCFWGTDNIINEIPTCDNSIVTPDTCTDIIFNIDYSNNTISSSFCGIDERSHLAADTCNKVGTACFGIRFYPWSAVLFSDNVLDGTKNQSFSSHIFFGKLTCELEARLWSTSNIYEKIRIAEDLLIKNLPSVLPNSNLMNSLFYILSHCGRARVSDICSYAAISPRQLERIYERSVGVSPKTFSELIRYQFLWNALLFDRGFDALDAVEKFGYFDQAHLLKDFKKRHLMTPREAVGFALRNR